MAESTTEAQAARRFQLIPVARICEVDALAVWLSVAEEPVSRALLAWAAARPDWSTVERAAWSKAVETILAMYDPYNGAGSGLWLPAVRAAGLLRLSGHGSRLLRMAKLDSNRAAALYALSRIPDLDGVQSELQARMRGFFMEADDVETRTAGLLLAERLLGESLDWDPSAPKDQRDKALEPILKRFEN